MSFLRGGETGNEAERAGFTDLKKTVFICKFRDFDMQNGQKSHGNEEPFWGGAETQSSYFFGFRLCRRLGIDGLKNVLPL